MKCSTSPGMDVRMSAKPGTRESGTRAATSSPATICRRENRPLVRKDDNGPSSQKPMAMAEEQTHIRLTGEREIACLTHVERRRTTAAIAQFIQGSDDQPGALALCLAYDPVERVPGAQRKVRAAVQN